MSEPITHLRCYTDKHIPRAVTTQLRQWGVDIIRCEDVGLGDVDDIAHLNYATKQGRVVITQDSDFTDLHYQWQAEGKSHAGIMYCLTRVQGEAVIGQIVKGVLMYHESIEGGAANVELDVTNQLIFIG